MLRGFLYDRLRILSPYWLRRWIKERRWFTPLSQRLFGAEVYSKSYFADIERLEGTSVEIISDWIAANLKPSRAIDVGCGPGHLMAALRRRGIDVCGVDISSEGLRSAREKGLAVERFDLSRRDVPLPGGPYDLAISCEVAEHLEAQHADAFVEKLAAAAPRIYLTAAEPDTGIGPGLHHVNEQPNAYWIEKLHRFGCRLDVEMTDLARRFLDRADVIDYLRKPMVFTRAAQAPGGGD